MPSSTSSKDLILHQSTIVRAGAGAGKTTALIQRFIDFSLDFKKIHDRWPRIVLTTFTKKATHEIRERLFQKALEQKNTELFEFINSSSMVQITTIHGLLSSFLLDGGLEMGLRPQPTIGDERLLDIEKRNILRKIFIEKPEWSEVLEIWRFGELLKILQEWSGEHIKKGTFTPWPLEDMQNEMREVLLFQALRVENVLQLIKENTTNEKWIAYRDGFPAGLKSLTLDKLYHRLQVWMEVRGKKPTYLKAKPPFEESLKSRFDEANKELEDLLDLQILDADVQKRMQEVHDLFDPLAQEFSKRYLKTRLEKGLLSFDDLEILSMKMMKEHPDNVKHFAKHWDFWLIDEYQDTSPLQVELLRELIGTSPHYIVGDPQQSIYLFRGARVEVFDAKMKEFEEKKQNIILQMTNYRSRKEILLFINRYFSYFQGKFSSMEVGSTVSNPKDPAVDVIPFTEEENEVERARDYIIARLNSGLKPEEICVLSRTHLMLTNLGQVLTDSQIDYQVHSHGKFFERDEIIDALTILKFLSNPHDNKNLIGLLRSPWFRMKETDIFDLCKGGSYWSNALRSLDPTTSRSKVILELQSILLRTKECGILDTFKNILIEKGLFQSSHTLDTTGQREANLWKLVLDLSGAEKQAGFSLSEYLRRIEENQDLSEGETEGEAAPFIEPRKVQLMTIHASKGLQFENVILLGYGRDQQKSRTKTLAYQENNYSISLKDEETSELIHSWLSYRVRKEINQREEEEYMRLLYVAFTRAKNKIALFTSPKPRKASWQSIATASWADINLGKMNAESPDDGELPLTQVIMDLPKQETYEKPETSREKFKEVKPYQVTDVQVLVKPESVTSQVATATKVKHWSPDSFKKIQKGVDFHRIVEALKYEVLGNERELADPGFQKALKFIRDQKEVPLVDLIKTGSVEWGFTIKRENQVTRGQIDLWSWYDNKLWVIDYKTGKSGDSTEMAFQQVGIYAQALQHIFPEYQEKTVKLVIVYPFEEKLIERSLS